MKPAYPENVSFDSLTHFSEGAQCSLYSFVHFIRFVTMSKNSIFSWLVMAPKLCCFVSQIIPPEPKPYHMVPVRDQDS